MHDILNYGPLKLTKDRLIIYAYDVIFYAPILSSPILIAVAIWQVIEARNLPQCGESIPKDSNNDMYGIGIRLATYLQLLLWCVAPILRDEKLGRSLSTVNNWFLIAFIAALISMLKDPEVQVIELYIIILLGNGLTVTMIQLTAPIATCWYYSYDTLASVLFKIFIMNVWKGLTTFFWWRLISDRLAAPSADGCRQFGYFVIRMTFANGSKLHDFHKTMNVFGWCFWFVTHLRVSLFTCFIIFRFIFWSLRPKKKQWYDALWGLIERHRGTGKDISALRNDKKRPGRFRILLDCMFTFPMGDFKAIIFGRAWLPEQSDGRARRGFGGVVDGPEKSPTDDTPDIDTVDKRFVNYLVSRYDLSRERCCSAHRSLTFQFFQAFFFTFAKEEKDSVWKARRTARDDCVHMVCLAIITLIIPVEFTIAVNKISGVNNFFQPGQLLALVVTIGALLAVAMRYIMGKRREDFGQPLYLPK